MIQVLFYHIFQINVVFPNKTTIFLSPLDSQAWISLQNPVRRPDNRGIVTVSAVSRLRGFKMFILIDNYDSFTWNLWHFVADLGAEVEIIRNNAVSATDIIARNPAGIIVSPGPGTPENAGIVMELILAAKKAGTPLLGVCLGHQALAAALGATIKRIDPPVHGKLSLVKKTRNTGVKSDILALCPDEFPVTRYHSLVVDEANLPDELKVTARTSAGVIMGLSHVEAELHGVQFHPESIASVAGYRILASFLQICGHRITSGEALDALEAQILRLDQRFPDQMHP